MLQQEEPDDYVVATGASHSVQDLVQLAFDHAGLDWKQHVVVDPKFKRPAEVDVLSVTHRRRAVSSAWSPRCSFPS